MEDCEPDWTMIPKMWNLHAFDWECPECGNRTYQGVKPIKCKCGGNAFDMVIVWKPRGNKVTYSWRFDKNMQFKYARPFWLSKCQKIYFPYCLLTVLIHLSTQIGNLLATTIESGIFNEILISN